MTYSAQFSCFVVNLIAYVILIEPHLSITSWTSCCRCELLASVDGMLLFDLSETLQRKA